MKSLRLLGLAAALLLSTVGVGGLGAQELKFDGYVNSGLGVVSTDIEDSDTFLKAFGVDSQQNGYRFQLNGSYQNEAGNAGVRLRLQSQATLANGYFSLPYVYGWLKFVNDIFYAAAGIVNDGTWATADWWLSGDRIDWGLGALLKATPVKGLDLGFGAYVVNVQAGGNNQILGDGKINFATVRPKIGDVKYTYSAAYTLPDVFRVGATFRWKNKAGYDANSALDGYQGRDESGRLIGEFRYLGVKDLTAVAAASFDKLEDFDNSGNVILSETFAYKLDSLNFGLNATQFLYNRKADAKPDKDLGLLFNLWGSYAFGGIVPRLDLAYFLGGQSSLGGNGNNTWGRTATGFASKLGTADVDDDYSVFTIRPSVKFNLNGRTFIEIGDSINFDSANFDAYRKDGRALSAATATTEAVTGDTKSRLSNVFYIDFKWSF
jgi:hypothetical protein